MLGILGIIVALVVLVVMIFRGWHMGVVAIVSSLIIILTEYGSISLMKPYWPASSGACVARAVNGSSNPARNGIAKASTLFIIFILMYYHCLQSEAADLCSLI